MLRKIKDLLSDIIFMIQCSIMYPKFNRLADGHLVYLKGTAYRYRGIRRHGFSDGMLPCYGVILEEIPDPMYEVGICNYPYEKEINPCHITF